MRAERRRMYERLALEARANVEEVLYPGEPGEDDAWGSYAGPARVRTPPRIAWVARCAAEW